MKKLQGRKKEVKVADGGSQIHLCFASDMHPYNCDGIFYGKGHCEHCDRKVTKHHHPKDCALCDPEYDLMPNKYWKKKAIKNP